MQNRNGETGAALILVAIVVLFAGIFVSLGLSVFAIKEAPDYERITRDRAEHLIDQLASFVHQNGRLPCPANMTLGAAGSAAFGREDRPGPGTACANTTGAVPFRALGLQERDAIDGWGRFFTYAVSPAFTNLDGISDTNAVIFDMCRRINLWVDDGERTTLPAAADGSSGLPDSGTMRNMNPRKAKFCCPGVTPPFALANTDIIITDIPDAPPARNIGGNSGQIDTSDTAGVAGPPVNDTAIAVLILSHGPNGLGAFLANGTRGIFPAPPNVKENENADGDATYSGGPRVLTDGPNYFDDILTYRTNTALYAELNAATCTRPYR